MEKTDAGKKVQMSVCCGNCICVQIVRNDGKADDFGFCRRHPPQAAQGAVNKVMVPGSAAQQGTAALWPPVRLQADYCMEFRPRLADDA